MRTHYSYRGAKVLYDFLASNQIRGTFLLPANICESVPATFREAGCDVQYADIDAYTLCIDERQVYDRIKECTGLLAVHAYGLQCNFESFYAKVHKVKQDAIIIDDRCLCWPDFEKVGLYDNAEADLILFSLGDKKQVQLGEGGVGILKDKWKAGNVKVDAHSMFENKSFSLDFKQYQHQKEVTKMHTYKLQTIYAETLPREIQLPMEYNNWRFNIRVEPDKKERILKSLFNGQLFASSHYKSLAEDAERTAPNAVKLQKEIINLFEDPFFSTEEQAIEACDIINKIIQAG